MSWANFLRDKELSMEEMKGRRCGFIGNQSNAPCEDMDLDNDLCCKKCILCIELPVVKDR